MRFAPLSAGLFFAVFQVPILAQPIPAKSKIVAATVVSRDPAAFHEWGAGDIEATFSDGQRKLLTQSGHCGRPEVSSSGDVGWSVWKDSNAGKYLHSGELLRVRLRDGTMRDFNLNSRFVQDWDFIEGGSAVAIANMGYHGPLLFIAYDLKTGRVLGQIDEYKPYAELPRWAQPLSDEKP